MHESTLDLFCNMNTSQYYQRLPINNMPDRYEDLFFKYQEEGLNHEEEVQLFQFLIDLELAWEIDDNFTKKAEYMIDEGLCYYVPTS